MTHTNARTNTHTHTGVSWIFLWNSAGMAAFTVMLTCCAFAYVRSMGLGRVTVWLLAAAGICACVVLDKALSILMLLSTAQNAHKWAYFSRHQSLKTPKMICVWVLTEVEYLCYAHAAPRQPYQLPDHTLMYAHIGRLAILHISNVTFICTWGKKKKDVRYFRDPGLNETCVLTVSLWYRYTESPG